MDVQSCEADNEICAGDSVGPMDPKELHEKYQEFLKANGSFDQSSYDEADNDEDYPSDELDNSLSSSSSPRNVEEISFNLDFSGLCAKNNGLRRKNNNLKIKNDSLQRQLELLEDERDKQKDKMLSMERELRSFQEVTREREDLQDEIVRLTEENNSALESKTKLDFEVKKLKKESLENFGTMNKMRDQIDLLTGEVDEKDLKNKTLNQELFMLKEQYKNTRLELQIKEHELTEKAQLYTNTSSALEHMKVVAEQFRNEKEMLHLQLVEVQLEVSLYQKGPEEIANKMKSSEDWVTLHSEIVEAEKSGGYLENGSDRWDLCKELNFNTSSEDTPKAPVFNRSASFPKRIKIVTRDALCQTVDHTTKDDDASLELQAKCKTLESKLATSLYENDDLKTNLDHQLTKVKQLSEQSKKLQQGNAETLEKVALLTEINCKLTAGKLGVWYDDMISAEGLPDNNSDSNDLIQIADNPQICYDASLDALNLESLSCLDTKSFASNPLYLAMKLKHDGDRRTPLRLASASFACDTTTIQARLLVLAKCKNCIEESVKKQIDRVCELMTSSSDMYEVREQLSQLRSTTLRVGRYAAAVRELECERRHSRIVQVLFDQLSNMSIKMSVMQRKAERCVRNAELNAQMTELQLATTTRERGGDQLEYSFDDPASILNSFQRLPCSAISWGKLRDTNSSWMVFLLILVLLISSYMLRQARRMGRAKVLGSLFVLFGYLTLEFPDYRLAPVGV